jgi:hypothetical protein
LSSSGSKAVSGGFLFLLFGLFQVAFIGEGTRQQSDVLFDCNAVLFGFFCFKYSLELGFWNLEF